MTRRSINSFSPNGAAIIGRFLALFALLGAGYAANPAFPLKISENGLYLVDQNDKPFYFSGEAAWSLIAQISNEDAVLYLDNRQAKGFTLVQVNLIEHAFSSHAPADYYGDLPFTGSPFITPNETYFAHADYIINLAAERGMAVLLYPLYLGWACGYQGWCQEVEDASLDDMYAWGQYVGNRYRNFDNIIWCIGADTDPTPVKAKVQRFVDGLLSMDDRHLMTAHNEPETYANDHWAGAAWLNVNNIYAYNSFVYVELYNEYMATQNRLLPVFLLETRYENEQNVSQLTLRSEAYWAMTYGAMGQIFGNCPIWHFGSDPNWCSSTNWKVNLESTGSMSMKYMNDFLSTTEWYRLVPDFDNTVMTAGYDGWNSTGYGTASLTDDGREMIAYIPNRRSVTVDMTKISGFQAVCKWMRPTSGVVTTFGTYPTTGTQSFIPPSGTTDWVLYIQGVPLFAATELLGRPTDTSVTLNMVPNTAMQVYVQYGTAPGDYSGATSTITATAGTPFEIEIGSLQPDTRYYYRVMYSTNSGSSWTARTEYTFHTRRAAGSAFSFVVQSDPRVADQDVTGNDGSPVIYQTALENEALAQPDFVIDLGNTFLGGDATSQTQTNDLYLGARDYFGGVAHSSPLFLAMGNLDGECGWLINNSGSNPAVWAANARKTYYLNPAPGSFYTGNTTVTPFITGDGLPADYYAWHWGDALFVVIDPYRYSTGGLASGEWDWSLGDAQYNWLKQTLEASTDKYKFVFAHQLFSIADAGRGGAARAGTGEWGASEADFTANRPTWTSHTAVQDLMAASGVTVFFHGNDNFFGIEDLDGVIYQECPMPSSSTAGYTGEYPDAYTLPSGGFLNISVASSESRLDYATSSLSGSEGQVVYSYDVFPDGSLPVTLRSFTVTPQSGGVLLTWRTESELENLGFEIYRSQTADSGYQILASYRDNDDLLGQGNSSSGKDYHFLDKTAAAGGIYWYKLADVDQSGRRTFTSPVRVKSAGGAALSRTFALSQNYPNPFNPVTTIRFSLPEAEMTRLGVYNILGELVATLVAGRLEAGDHSVRFDAGQLTAGVYLYRLEAGSRRQVRKMVLLK